jgi:hypothetical protein
LKPPLLALPPLNRCPAAKPKIATIENRNELAMTLTIELPDNLEAALRAQATASGISEERYIRRVLERDLAGPAPEEASEQTDAHHAEILHRSQRAAERIRELRKGNILPEGVTIRDLIDQGRA